MRCATREQTRRDEMKLSRSGRGDERLQTGVVAKIAGCRAGTGSHAGQRPDLRSGDVQRPRAGHLGRGSPDTARLVRQVCLRLGGAVDVVAADGARAGFGAGHRIDLACVGAEHGRGATPDAVVLGYRERVSDIGPVEVIPAGSAVAGGGARDRVDLAVAESRQLVAFAHTPFFSLTTNGKS